MKLTAKSVDLTLLLLLFLTCSLGGRRRRPHRHLPPARHHPALGVPSRRLGAAQRPVRAAGGAVGHLPRRLRGPAELAAAQEPAGALRHPGDGVQPAALGAARSTM